MNIPNPTRHMSPTFDGLDRSITEFLAKHALTYLRVALGLVFLWFGALKFFPDLSPASALATRTISLLTWGAVPATVSLPVLATWETLIGAGLLSGKFLRATLLLLLLQMLGTVAPLVLLPTETWHVFPYALTLEGQYIVKNMVLVAAGLTLGATVRGPRVLDA